MKLDMRYSPLSWVLFPSVGSSFRQTAAPHSARRRSQRGAVEKELAQTRKDHAKLVDAIIAGVPADQVKDRMLALDARQIELEGQLISDPAPSPLRIHPKMAETYREKVGALIARLQEPDSMPEAKDALRGLIDRIVLSRTAPDGKLSIHLEGVLAALLRLGSGGKTQKDLSDKTQAFAYNAELGLIAGGCNRGCLPLFQCMI